jgi:hypothetical protein
MGWAGLLAIALAALSFSERTPFPGTSALLPTVGAALAIAAGIGSRPSSWGVGRLLALRPMRFVGDRSYAFYLWHWPVLILAGQYVGYELSVPVKLALLAAAFLLSCVSYALVENPIRRTRGRAAGGVVFGVSIAAVIGTAVLSLAAITREQQRFDAPVASAAVVTPMPALASRMSTRVTGALPEVVAAVQAARRGEPIPSGLSPPISGLQTVPPRYALPPDCISLGRSSSSTSRVCRLGQVTSQKLIVLIGDSHAMMWLPAVLEMAWRDGWAVVPLLRTGCLPQWWKNDNSPTRSCRTWLDWATRQIGSLRPRVTLIGGFTAETRDRPARAATDAIIAKATTLKAGGTVVVIGDPEGLSENPIDSVLARHASMRTITTTWPASALRPYNRIAAQARKLGIGFLATRGFLCFQRRCPAVIGHTIAYRDNNHITAAYAAQVADAFRKAFLRAVGNAR